MKLTNKQLSLVVDMIYDKVKPSYDSLAKREIDELTAQAKAIITKTSAYKMLKKLLPNPDIAKVEIKKSVLSSIFSRRDYRYHTDVESADEFLKVMTEEYIDHYKQPKNDIKQEIEKKVMLSMLNASDLNELVDTIAKSFIK
jgi:hypothetical protein